MTREWLIEFKENLLDAFDLIAIWTMRTIKITFLVIVVLIGYYKHNEKTECHPRGESLGLTNIFIVSEAQNMVPAYCAGIDEDWDLVTYRGPEISEKDRSQYGHPRHPRY